MCDRQWYTKQQIFVSTKFISIRTHKKIENINDPFRDYKDSVILNSALEFPVNFVWTEIRSFTYVLNVH